jgi:hypothetical protein
LPPAGLPDAPSPVQQPGNPPAAVIPPTDLPPDANPNAILPADANPDAILPAPGATPSETDTLTSEELQQLDSVSPLFPTQ